HQKRKAQDQNDLGKANLEHAARKPSDARGLAARLARARIEVGVLVVVRELLVLFFFSFGQRLSESSHRAAQIGADRAQALRAENEQRDREDDQQLFETDAHTSSPARERRMIRQMPGTARVSHASTAACAYAPTRRFSLPRV